MTLRCRVKKKKKKERTVERPSQSPPPFTIYLGIVLTVHGLSLGVGLCHGHDYIAANNTVKYTKYSLKLKIRVFKLSAGSLL